MQKKDKRHRDHSRKQGHGRFELAKCSRLTDCLPKSPTLAVKQTLFTAL